MSTFRRPFAAGSVVACFAVLAAAWRGDAAFVPVSSSVELSAQADANDNLVTDTRMASEGASLNPLSVSVDALSTSGSSTWRTTGTLTATYDNFGHAQVSYTDITFAYHLVNATAQSSGDLRRFFQPDWTYTFVADTSGTLELDYDVQPPVGGVGSEQFTVYFNNQPAEIVTGTGSFTRSVIAGQTYTVGIGNNYNRVVSGGTGDGTFQDSASFTLSGPGGPLTVPEPASCVLVGVGAVTLVGYRSWRRRSA